MKRSSKILSGAIIILVILSFTGIIVSRLYFNSLIGNEYKSAGSIKIENSKTESYSNTGFNSLTFSGNWKISIIRGAGYSIRISGPANLLKNTEVTQKGQILNIANKNTPVAHESTFSIEITLPDMEELNTTGFVFLDFTGFSGDSLTIDLSGAGRISGFESSYENLNILCSGAGQLDLSDCQSVNANVNLSGAGEVLLNMDGGKLEGRISGLGSVDYKGRIKENTLNVSGLGSVKSQ